MSPAVPDADDTPIDLLVVGGGINGAAIARDAAGRGLSVMLVEQDDLAAHTSSASSKLIHGGLRYLEHREFGLVRKALAEREVLLRAAPHLVRVRPFVLPLAAGMRPAWMIRAGLFLYDHLARRERVPASYAVDLRRHVAGMALRDAPARGFVYADAETDDARLVVTVAIDCAERGGAILPRTRCESARREGTHWRVTLVDIAGARRDVRARALVNATGPWAARFLAKELGARGARALRLVRGSHIVVPALFDHGYAYTLQQPDGRVVFAMPYEGGHTLIGTTEVEHRDDPARVRASAEEIAYLCAAANRSFAHEVAPHDVLWQFSGVRPLLDAEAGLPTRLSRDYELALDTEGAPLLNVFGGKLTTFRVLAEEALDRLAPLLGCRQGAWTREAMLPGGDVPLGDLESFVGEAARAYGWLPEALRVRWLAAYGTRIVRLVGDAHGMDALGEEIVPGLREAELRYLAVHEWASSGEDVLWRRTKLGLALPVKQRARAVRRVDEALRRMGFAAHVDSRLRGNDES